MFSFFSFFFLFFFFLFFIFFFFFFFFSSRRRHTRFDCDWSSDVCSSDLLQETIRNLYFHVCMWFGMMILFTVSVIYAIKYLRSNNLVHDIYSRQYATMGIVFGVLGYLTGIIWMSYTWADPNNPAYASFSTIAREPKLIGAAIALLIYFAYLVLRDSIQDIDKKARVSAV